MATMPDGCTPWPDEFAARYRAAGHWRGNTLDTLLRGWAMAYAPRTALVHDGTRLTYGNLNRRVDRVAAGFRLRGLRAGQRVVVQLPDVPELVVTAFALMRVGAAPVFCPLSYRTAEVAHVVRVTEAVGYVGPAVHQGFDHTAMAADIAARGPFLRRVFTYEPPAAASPYGGLATDVSGCHYFPLGSVDAPPDAPLARGAGQVAFFLPSGGAPGAPRLVARTHDDYAYQTRAAAEAASLTEDDVYLAAPPAGPGFASGCPGVVGVLSVGGTVVQAHDPGPAACLAAVGRERVTVASVASADAERWLDVLSAVRSDVSSLRLVQLAGAPVSGAVAERMGRAWGCRLQQVFGRAEGPLVLTRPAGPDGTALTARGRPLSPDDEIRIVGPDGADVPDGETGELLARGPYTVRGYYRAPEDDARRFTHDGFFRTGDLARRTPDGDLVMAGRVADAP
ncbi:AMP-binding protein [Streptomyces sp. SID486]|uniref:AMP-binding protein n=1 Tax=Streptomyces sp. SID486 TaxID=2690264 RepID=UPI001F3147EF|nr:AMP-binding protein [Streptomyces sp. SID486]